MGLLRLAGGGFRRVDGEAVEGFGQIGIGQEPGRAVQRRVQAEAADEDEEGQAQDAMRAAAGAGDVMGDFTQGVTRAGLGEGFEQALPEALVGEAAEIAVDGVGLAVFRREAFPRGMGAGDVENGVHALAQVADLAACGGAREEVGEEGVELEVGEGAGHITIIGNKTK